MTDKIPSASRIAVLGTGKMGSTLAARLAEVGHDVVLWNRTRSKAEALGLGTVAETPAAATRDADIVVSSLTGPEAVLATYLGPDGALTSGDGKLFVEMSTAGPDLEAALAAHVSCGGRQTGRRPHRHLAIVAVVTALGGPLQADCCCSPWWSPAAAGGWPATSPRRAPRPSDDSHRAEGRTHSCSSGIRSVPSPSPAPRSCRGAR